MRLIEDAWMLPSFAAGSNPLNLTFHNMKQCNDWCLDNLSYQLFLSWHSTNSQQCDLERKRRKRSHFRWMAKSLQKQQKSLEWKFRKSCSKRLFGATFGCFAHCMQWKVLGYRFLWHFRPPACKILLEKHAFHWNPLFTSFSFRFFVICDTWRSTSRLLLNFNIYHGPLTTSSD